MCLSGWHPGHSAVLSLSHGRPVWPVEQRVEDTAALPAGQTIIIRLYRWPLPALPHSSSNVFRSQHLSSTWLPSPWWRFSPGRLLCISSAWTREVRWFLWISWMLLGSVCPGLTTQEIPSQTSLQLQNFNQQVYLVSWTFRCETSDGWDVFVCSPWKQLHHPPGVQLIGNPSCTSALWRTCLALIIWLLFVFIFLSSSSEQKFCQILSPSFYFYSFFSLAFLFCLWVPPLFDLSVSASHFGLHGTVPGCHGDPAGWVMLSHVGGLQICFCWNTE